MSTNAGGGNALRCGTARALCLGIEAVLPDGSIMHDLKRLRKDNTGYDLRDLLIGAEGAWHHHRRQPEAGAAARREWRGADGGARSCCGACAAGTGRKALGDCVTAFELISGQGPFPDRDHARAAPALRQPPDWMVLIEIGLPSGLEPDAALETLFGTALEEGLVLDGLIAQSGQQAADFWRLREEIPEANRLIGSISSHDISLPLSEVPRFIIDAGAMLAQRGDMRINSFRHLGDGTHYNVFPAAGRKRGEYDDMRNAIQQSVHEMVVSRGGSFSAEHGVGRLKVADLERWATRRGWRRCARSKRRLIRLAS